jgi:hypothetical protein
VKEGSKLMPFKDPEKNLATGKERARKWAENNPERAAFKSQRSSATKRGIRFLLSFDEWWKIWQASGKWEQRGRLAGQYVMARFGDSGPYAANNVRICTKGENYDEYISALSDEQRRAIGQRGLGNRLTDEQRQRLSKAIKAMWSRGARAPITEKTRQKYVAAQKARWARIPAAERQAHAAKMRIARYGK